LGALGVRAVVTQREDMSSAKVVVSVATVDGEAGLTVENR
jgi:hypothetical protein